MRRREVVTEVLDKGRIKTTASIIISSSSSSSRL